MTRCFRKVSWFLRRFRSIFDVWRWRLEGKPAPPPHTVKQRTVKEYAKRFDLKILIETGTCLGDMINATRRTFNTIYSIELDDSLYERVKKKFSKFPHIHILHGDSGKILPDILSSISQPCLFWLDAHYSGGITAKGDRETPILEELQCILNHRILDHVILIDDARCFVGQKDYPIVDEVRALVSNYRPDWIVEVEYDIIRVHRRLREARV